MSPYASISVIYNVEVQIPEDVFRRFGHTEEYTRVSKYASGLVEASGQNSYSSVVEWGEAPSRGACEDFAAYWHNWILQWQEHLKSAHGPDPER